jgi:tRNA (guanine-N7-)-methyltransferase
MKQDLRVLMFISDRNFMPLRHTDSFYDPTNIDNRGINPYLAEVQRVIATEEIPIYTGQRLKNIAKNWRNTLQLSAQTPLVLEIGSYKGDTLVTYAQQCPTSYFLGADITFKRMALTARRIQKHQLTNSALIFSRISGSTLTNLFQREELDGVLAFYPDPWNKKRQQHNRLINDDLANALKKVLRPGGFFWCKTDQKSYFESVTAIMDRAGFRRLPAVPPTWDDIEHKTPFETRFLTQGIAKNEGFWVNSQTYIDQKALP